MVETQVKDFSQQNQSVQRHFSFFFLFVETKTVESFKMPDLKYF